MKLGPSYKWLSDLKELVSILIYIHVYEILLFISCYMHGYKTKCKQDFKKVGCTSIYPGQWISTVFFVSKIYFIFFT